MSLNESWMITDDDDMRDDACLTPSVHQPLVLIGNMKSDQSRVGVKHLNFDIRTRNCHFLDFHQDGSPQPINIKD